jgi:oligopeptide transport system substrate-binding protein
MKVGKQGENASNYDNPEFDRLFERMRNMDNGPQRQEIIEKMVLIAQRDAPWVWGYHPKQYTLRHEWVHNNKLNHIANNTLKYRRLDPELRAAQREAWNRPMLWPIIALIIIIGASLIPAVRTYRARERRSQLQSSGITAT